MKIISESNIYKELDKYIRFISVSIKNEYDTYVVYADYEDIAHCRVELNYDYLKRDFEHYLKAEARNIVGLISYEYFYTKEYKKGD